jgi:hypothetical protein
MSATFAREVGEGRVTRQVKILDALDTKSLVGPSLASDQLSLCRDPRQMDGTPLPLGSGLGLRMGEAQRERVIAWLKHPNKWCVVMLVCSSLPVTITQPVVSELWSVRASTLVRMSEMLMAVPSQTSISKRGVVPSRSKPTALIGEP